MQNRIGVSLKFYDKFSSIWDGLGIKDKTLSTACSVQVKRAAWLLFILAKIRVLNSQRGREDIAELAFLLFAVLRFCVLLLPSQVTCELLDKLPSRDVPSVEAAVKDYLQKALKMPSGLEETTVVGD